MVAVWRTGCAILALVVALPQAQARAGAAEEWFDAYGRGVAALRERQGAEAVVAFRRAIKRRRTPGSYLITYGTNRLDHYHPYLRLAEAHLMQGDVAAAREALRRSEAIGREPGVERARLQVLVDSAQKEGAAAVPRAPDAELAAAVRQVESGDFEAGALALESVTRRLAGDAERSPELARAYLYLGIAYIGLSQRTGPRPASVP